MTYRSLIPVVEELSEANLTVIAQTRALNNTGTLRWPLFFPRQDVDSVDIHEITDLDFRPVSDRREWNSPGRLIHSKTPATKKISITPVEGYYKWGEYEMNKMNEPTLGLQSNVAAILTRDIPSKVRQIVDSNLRRIELETFRAIIGTTPTMLCRSYRHCFEVHTYNNLQIFKPLFTPKIEGFRRFCKRVMEPLNGLYSLV